MKLRPVAAGASKAAKHLRNEPSNESEDQNEITEGVKQPTKLPFSKVVLCVSGVRDKVSVVLKNILNYYTD